jgi:hypothetical protein
VRLHDSMDTSNRTVASLISGAVGSISLNLMHECARNSVAEAPRIDLIGMRAVQKLTQAVGIQPPKHLRQTTLAGDLVANTLYYSTVGARGPEHAVAVGAIAGLLAGIGVLVLPDPLGLGSEEVNRAGSTQIMAAGMYFAAGVISGLTYHLLARRRED